MEAITANHKSPLSPRTANNSTPATIDRKKSHKASDTPVFAIHQDIENIPNEAFDRQRTLNSPSKFPLSPAKSATPAKYALPRMAEEEEARSVPLTEDALRENEGLTRAIEMMNGGDSIVDLYQHNDTPSLAGTTAGFPGMDDTCFSTFSAVPNTDMTLFASPSKASSPAKRSREAQYNAEARTPRPIGRSSPTSSRRHQHDECSPSPTPRRPKSNREGETTNLIMDFTEQFNAFSQTSHISPSRYSRLSPRKFNTQPDLNSFDRRTPSPAKGLPSTPYRSHHLLDFDLPPAPTPRSIPTITARELESLKSSFLSQISNLRATLSGKEAEVESLKAAVTDAERRGGEAQEEIREQRGQRESLQAEKEEWEVRHKEMQSVLRGAKEDIIHEQHEQEQLQQRLAASEKKREESEGKLVEAESKIAGLQAAAAAAPPAPSGGEATPGAGGNGNVAVEAAVEKVARELHGLYKSKHETKVAALKKSYEARWEKKVRDLERRIRDLNQENEDLRIGKDATMSGVVPGGLQPSLGQEVTEDVAKRRENEVGQLDEQRARLEELSEEVRQVRSENESLQSQLATERTGMAELVKATEEMMQLSLASAPGDEKPAENLRGSISKVSSGLKQPGSTALGESRIGRMGRSGSGLGPGALGRSGMMSNIERMGRVRGD